MKFDGRWLVVFLVVISSVISTGTCVSISITGGNSATINGADSTQGVSTPDGTTIMATGSIRAALDNAIPGATISLLPKTYYEIVQVPISLNIIGAGSGSTIVDGQQLGSVFIIPSGVTVGLADMTIQNGMTQSGGGIYNAGTLTVKGCKITGNTAYNDGGGVCNYGTATVTGSTISGNLAYYNGGGICNEDVATVIVTDSTISGNANWEDGSGIWNGGTATVTDSTISGNTAYRGDGGGFYNQGDIVPGLATISDSTISGNFAYYGGGICNVGIATVTSSTIYGNTAYYDGGGVCNYGTATVTGSTISGNTAERNGGGFFNSGTGAELSLSNSLITGNTAYSDGGGIYNTNGGSYNPNSNSSLVVGETTQITNNQATTGYGGGIYSDAGSVTFDGKNVGVKYNKAHLPATGSSWYQGWGVYLTSEVPITKNGFYSATQVTGNVNV
jgi:predicted outer membrane repeat protein